MRITPVNTFRTYVNKPQNVSFGKIEETNREKIIENLPVEASNEEDRKLYKQWDVGALDNNNGVMVKWGGEGHPRGLIYADLIKEHVERSDFKKDYLEMTPEYWGDDEMGLKSNACVDNLENSRMYKRFMSNINYLSSKENPDGSRRKISSVSSTDSEYKPDREERMWDLYGTRL